jgi:uncharacterized protein
MKRPNLDIILMPTLACNLACDYCYILEKQSGMISETVLERALEGVFRHNDPRYPTNIYWHGSEPLLAGIDFYRSVCRLIHQRYGDHEVRHHIQTNGILLNDEWFDFFIEEHITTGVSLDGPKELHDAYRKTHDGRGSFDLVFNNIMAARKKKLYLDALCVITRRTLGHEDELFNFFYEHKISFGFEPLIPENEWMWHELSITPEAYARVSISLFDRWFYQPERRLDAVMPAYHFAHAIMTGENSYCKFAGDCANNYITVAPDGQVHSCIMFARDPRLAFGNIAKQTLEEILASPVRREFLKERVSSSNGCEKCRWVTLCHAGCPYQAFVQTGSILERDMFCRSYRLIFDHVSKTIASELDRVRQGETPFSEAAQH